MMKSLKYDEITLIKATTEQIRQHKLTKDDYLVIDRDKFVMFIELTYQAINEWTLDYLMHWIRKNIKKVNEAKKNEVKK